MKIIQRSFNLLVICSIDNKRESVWERCSIGHQFNPGSATCATNNMAIPNNNRNNVEIKFDDLNKTNKNFIQSTFYYHPFFSNSAYSQLNSYQINSIQALQQDNEQHQQVNSQLQHDQLAQQHSNQVDDHENQQYDENANLRLLMDVAVSVWEEQQRNFNFRN
jgi:hypothetical protein